MDSISASANISSWAESLPVLKDWIGKPKKAIQENVMQNRENTDQIAKEALTTLDLGIETEGEDTTSELNSTSSTDHKATLEAD